MCRILALRSDTNRQVDTLTQLHSVEPHNPCRYIRHVRDCSNNKLRSQVHLLGDKVVNCGLP